MYDSFTSNVQVTAVSPKPTVKTSPTRTERRLPARHYTTVRFTATHTPNFITHTAEHVCSDTERVAKTTQTHASVCYLDWSQTNKLEDNIKMDYLQCLEQYAEKKVNSNFNITQKSQNGSRNDSEICSGKYKQEWEMFNVIKRNNRRDRRTVRATTETPGFILFAAKTSTTNLQVSSLQQ